MKAIAISVATDRPTALECANAIIRMAGDAGVAVAIADHAPGLAATNGATVADAEMIVTVGGDGTLLRGVRLAVPLDVPLLGDGAMLPLGDRFAQHLALAQVLARVLGGLRITQDQLRG